MQRIVSRCPAELRAVFARWLLLASPVVSKEFSKSEQPSNNEVISVNDVPLRKSCDVKKPECIVKELSTTTGRTIFVGDIHACNDELLELINRVKYVQGKDQLILLGDIVGKGPLPAAVIRSAIALNAWVIRGNHDEAAIRVRRQADEAGADQSGVPEEFRYLWDLSEEEWTWFSSLPHILRIPQYNMIAVHAGIEPKKALEEQNPHTVMHMRNLDGAVGIESAARGEPWARVYQGPELVVFGHDAVRSLQQHENAIGLDTGCVYGGKLTALVLPDVSLVSVSAFRVHCAPKPSPHLLKMPLSPRCMVPSETVLSPRATKVGNSLG